MSKKITGRHVSIVADADGAPNLEYGDPVDYSVTEDFKPNDSFARGGVRYYAIERDEELLFISEDDSHTELGAALMADPAVTETSPNGNPD